MTNGPIPRSSLGSRWVDNIGWDGRYGMFAVWDWSNKVVARVGYRHLSAHLGDE